MKKVPKIKPIQEAIMKKAPKIKTIQEEIQELAAQTVIEIQRRMNTGELHDSGKIVDFLEGFKAFAAKK